MTTVSSKCLIIVGMHRSGTSFTASLLQNAGLNIGSNLLEGAIGNALGYFENEDFLTFHKTVLTKRGDNSDGWSLRAVNTLEPEELSELQAIIKSNESEQWGWKDPRTTLFLNIYKQLLPDAIFLFVYRKPWEVIDSLFRRNTDIEFIKNAKSTCNNWLYYNQLILDFFKTNKERALLIDIESIMNDSTTFIELLNSTFNFSLNSKPKPVFKEDQFQNNSKQIQQLLCETAFPECIDQFKILQKESSIKPPQEYIHSDITQDSLIEWWRYYVSIIEITKKINPKNSDTSSIFLAIKNTECENIALKNENKHLSNEIDWMTKSIWWKIRSYFKKFF